MSDTSGAVVINGSVTRWLLGIFASMIGIGAVSSIAIIRQYGERLSDLERFEASTESNRFTTGDALRLQQAIRAHHDATVPPREVLIRLERLERDIENHDHRE